MSYPDDILKGMLLVHKAFKRALKNHWPRLFAAFASLPVLLFLAVAQVIAATMPAVKMKVVDGRDGAPIPGLVALFFGTAREGTFTGHGGRQAILFAVEAVSDAAGELRFPKQDFKSQPFFLNTNYENPTMLLLKPGYAPLFLHNQLRNVPTLAEVSIWEYEGQTLKMKKAPDNDMLHTDHLLTTYTNMMLAFDGRCGWKRVPRTLVAADHMFPHSRTMSTLRFLFSNEGLFVQQGCGSPKVFFEPYLRPLTSGAEAATSCLADGESVQWIADYCMLKMETDDEIAVSGCIEEERRVRFANNCASNLHFKRRMCELMIRNGTRAGTLDLCVNDPAFKGRTIETGGVGAYRGR